MNTQETETTAAWEKSVISMEMTGSDGLKKVIGTCGLSSLVVNWDHTQL